MCKFCGKEDQRVNGMCKVCECKRYGHELNYRKDFCVRCRSILLPNGERETLKPHLVLD